MPNPFAGLSWSLLDSALWGTTEKAADFGEM